MRISDWSSDVCSSELHVRPENQSAKSTGSGCLRPPLSFLRHAELVSASMAGSRGRHRDSFEGGPWTLKQVQGDKRRKTIFCAKEVACSFPVARTETLLGRFSSKYSHVGKACVITCRARCSRSHQKKT